MCKRCGGIKLATPSMEKQKKTRCLDCGVLLLLSEFWKSDINSFFYNPENGKGDFAVNIVEGKENPFASLLRKGELNNV